MSWTRHFEMKDEGKSLGKIICLYRNDGSEYCAEISFTDLKFLQDFQEENGRIVRITLPRGNIYAKSEEELMKSINDLLKSIGPGITIDQILR